MPDNPFADLSVFISPAAMKSFVIIMILLAVAGTLFDVVHKGSARCFFENWKKSKRMGTKKVGAGQMASLAVTTLAVDVAASGEFCSTRHRIAHLLTMYGFIGFAVATAVMVFSYPTPAQPTPAIWSVIWHLGALMVCIGGYWFWFFIRVDSDILVVGGISVFYTTNTPLMERGLELMEWLKEDCEKLAAEDLYQLQRAWELQHRVMASESVLRHTMFREETRSPGYYYRADYPKLDDENWHCFTPSRFDPKSGEWGMEKAPAYHFVD